VRISSPWIATAPTPGYAPLAGDRRADVCVIGAGILGLTTALLLAEAGRSVVVLEMDEAGAGVSGYTTAKLGVLHGTAFQDIRSRHSSEAAEVYAQANLAGLELIARWVDERGIDCDFRRRTDHTYAAEPDAASDIEETAEAAQAAGLKAQLTTDTDLPYEVHAAVRLDGMAEFHPRRYLLALAAALPEGSLHEGTRVTGVEDGSPCRVHTDHGVVEADEVVVATHYPMLDRGLFFARLSPERSYALGVHVAGPVPQGMYISTGSTTRSIRSHPLDDGELLIVGGEGHKTGQGGSTTERYERLERFAREHWDVREVAYRWASQDCQPADGLPYVGKVSPVSKHLWTGTGFRKWGLTNGTASAMILADRLLERENPWADTLDSNRFTPRASATTLVKENVNVGLHFFADRLAPPDASSLEELQPGQGGIVRVDGERLAAFRDDDGTLHTVSPVCTHLGCHVKFNDAERTWDCPCHGSRFDVDGTVIEGPAVRDLEGVSASGTSQAPTSGRRHNDS
jgi:glycine/D-amino acid oxidase-like deaminating enzyme/nitrite reductase/ring-hydroxylating ferredoxin subunit